MLKILEDLFLLARERKNNPISGSYTNKLLADKSLSKSKVLEEINELIDAVEEDSNKIHEAADVFYHLIMSLLVMNMEVIRYQILFYFHLKIYQLNQLTIFLLLLIFVASFPLHHYFCGK